MWCYFEVAAGPIMKAEEVLDKGSEATNSEGSIFKTDEMFEIDEYIEAHGQIVMVGEVLDEVTLTKLADVLVKQ